MFGSTPSECLPQGNRKLRKSERGNHVLSDLKNLNVMLGNHPENQSDVDLNENVEVDSRSNGTRTDMVRNCEDFRTLLTSEDRNRCEMTMETNRLISEEISYQMNRKIDELKRNLDTQITESINSAIHDSILPSIQNSLSGQNSGLGTNVDSRSSRLSRNTEGKKHQSVWENTKCRVQSSSNNHPQSRDCSLSSLDCRDDHDMVTGANPTPHMVPEFLTGQPTQSRDNPQSQDPIDPQSPTTSPQHQETIGHNPAIDPLTRLANVLTGMTNKQIPQTLMVRPVSTTTLTFDGKSEKFELFEDLFHTMIKMQPELTETMKINHFHSLLRKNALQTFRNINSANRQTLEDVLAVFRRKYVKPESQATAKHKWHKLVFDPNTIKLPDFLEELNQGAEKAFEENAQAMIDSLLYAKLPPKLKRSVNMARLENASYEEIVTHLERELELNGLEGGDDITVPTMSTAATATRPGTGLLSSGIDPNITCNYCKIPGHVKDECRKLKRKEEQRRNDGQDTKKEYPKCPTCDKTKHPAERCWKGAGAHLKPKNLKIEDAKPDNASPSQSETNNKQTNSILKNPKTRVATTIQNYASDNI